MYIAVVNDCTWHATDRTYLSFHCGTLLRNIDDGSLCRKKIKCSLLLNIVLRRLSSWLPLKSKRYFFGSFCYVVDQNACAQYGISTTKPEVRFLKTQI